ncbi:MAG: flagellar basal body-associated FliL family protein [Pseudomonadota bacterium]
MSDIANPEADLDQDADAQPKKRGKMGLILGLVALLATGGGGFFATYSGMLALPIGGSDGAEAEAEKAPKKNLAPVAFFSTGEMIISLGPRARSKHLLIEAELEAEPSSLSDLELLRPRVLDVFNTYLRAVEERDLEDPGSMPRIRAQLLRRVKIVTGPDMVRDLLITRFVLK